MVTVRIIELMDTLAEKLEYVSDAKAASFILKSSRMSHDIPADEKHVAIRMIVMSDVTTIVAAILLLMRDRRR